MNTLGRIIQKPIFFPICYRQHSEQTQRWTDQINIYSYREITLDLNYIFNREIFLYAGFYFFFILPDLSKIYTYITFVEPLHVTFVEQLHLLQLKWL